MRKKLILFHAKGKSFNVLLNVVFIIISHTQCKTVRQYNKEKSGKHKSPVKKDNQC